MITPAGLDHGKDEPCQRLERRTQQRTLEYEETREKKREEGIEDDLEKKPPKGYKPKGSKMIAGMPRRHPEITEKQENKERKTA